MTRILAHYTIYEGKVWHLHTFEITKAQIRHYPFENELSMTRFVEGIAIVCHALPENDMEKLGNAKPMPRESLREYAERLCQLVPAAGQDAYSTYIIEHGNHIRAL